MMVLTAVASLAPLALADPTISWVTNDLNRKGWYSMRAVYPQFRGNAVARLASKGVRETVNARLAAFQRNASLASARPARAWRVDWKGRVGAATARFVSILGTCEYDTGGARASADVVGLNYAIRGGTVKRLTLSDLMVVRTDPVFLATEAALPKLSSMGVESVTSGRVTALTRAQADNFVMTPAGLSWLFAPGEIAPRERGTIVAKVTWEELGGKVTKDL